MRTSFTPGIISAGSIPCLCSLCAGFCFPYSCGEKEQFQVKGQSVPFPSRILNPVGNKLSVPHQLCSLLSLVHKDIKIRRGYFLLFCFSIKVECLHYRCPVCSYSTRWKLPHLSINLLNSLCVYINVCIHLHI